MALLTTGVAATRAAVAAAGHAGTLPIGATVTRGAARQYHATLGTAGLLDRLLGVSQGGHPNGEKDHSHASPLGDLPKEKKENSSGSLLGGLFNMAAETRLVPAPRPYPGEPLREELIATDEVKAEINRIDHELAAIDDLSDHAALLRQQRRNLLFPFRKQCEAEDEKRWKTEDHRIERAKNPAKPRIIYFWRHLPMGKIFVNDTQFLDYKQFHHQTSLKKWQKIVKLRRDHWEPLLAVTGLKYAADVKRIIEKSLCPDKQVKEREGRRKLRENRGTRLTPGPKPPKAMIRATETLEFSKKSVTRLAIALRELQEDVGDLHTAGVEIWWSRVPDKRILLCRGTDTRKDLLTPGEWPEWIKHRKLETDRTNLHIMNIHEDISYEVETRRRYQWRQEMCEPGEPWYPKRAPGRKLWLMAQWNRRAVRSPRG